MTKYEELKNLQEKEINNLPLHFAFGNKQLEEKANELGFKNVEELTKNVTGIGAGGFVLNKDFNKVMETFKRQAEEIQKLIDLDDEFLESAFEYELGNHEYIITYDITDTLRALSISYQEFSNSERMQKIMEKAKNKYLEAMKNLGW